jgi:Toprim-like
VELLPQSYVIQNIYTYCKRPAYRKYQGTYNAECCICGEGASAGRKRRLFYFVNDRYFYCFNCSRSWQEVNWLQEVSKKTFTEIVRESKQYDNTSDIIRQLSAVEVPKVDIPYLPDDCVDLTDIKQIEYYNGTTQDKLIKQALNYCSNRRLFTAVNKPKTFYISFDDKVHKNRLIIPFYSEKNKIESYQSRSLNGDDYPKYLTKYGEKCLYGENNINSDIPYIFVFEGPIDAMFVQNAVAIGGASTTERQMQFLNKCIGYEVIYVYDNDKNNEEMDAKIQKLIKQNKRIFIWPKEFSKYKDINEVCVSLGLNEFPYKYIIDNSYTGIEAQLKESLRKS